MSDTVEISLTCYVVKNSHIFLHDQLTLGWDVVELAGYYLPLLLKFFGFNQHVITVSIAQLLYSNRTWIKKVTVFTMDFCSRRTFIICLLQQKALKFFNLSDMFVKFMEYKFHSIISFYYDLLLSLFSVNFQRNIYVVIYTHIKVYKLSSSIYKTLTSIVQSPL